MKGVSLVSGGLDSTLAARLLQDEGAVQVPVFIDYGQLAASMEWHACKSNLEILGLPAPLRLNLSDFGKVVKSGITSRSKDIVRDAFLPCRNLLFLVVGASIAVDTGGSFVSIGFLSEDFSLFPDQSQRFLDSVERTLEVSLGKRVKVLSPLFDFSKADAIVLAKKLGIEIDKVYSCHAGGRKSCGLCISCKERAEANEILEAIEKGGE
ncbi:MAG: 7-cyano-7-deazaguanine synthase [Thermoplasmata archaeon]